MHSKNVKSKSFRINATLGALVVLCGLISPATFGPAPVKANATQAAQVAAGEQHTCVLTDGAVECLGSNEFGQLGNGSTTDSLAAVEVTGLETGVTAIALGTFHSCAIVGGAVKCWGNNEDGQLGNNSTVDSSIPVQVFGLETGVTSIALGSYHSCAIVSGAAKCWGNNFSGQLGDGTRVDRLQPVQVTGLTGLTSAVTAIALGSGYSCAIVGGAAKCWGYNGDGQLGDGSYVNRLEPVDVYGLSSGVTAIALGEGQSCAIVGGAAKCWGYNGYGQLGDGSGDDSLQPVQVTGLQTGVTAISLGGLHSCAIVSGAAKCWGSNEFGQLGNGSAGPDDSLEPVQVTGLTSAVTAISLGYEYSCVIVSGAVKCWGLNEDGQLGTGAKTNQTLPVETITSGSDVTAIALGDSHSCAIVSGVAKCWGNNFSGQLGNGTTEASFVPVAVTQLGTGVTAIALGESHSCAIVSGAAKCWGKNDYGQLGNGTTGISLSPVQVTGLETGVTAIALGNSHSCAIVSDVAKCWGMNLNGQLGNGSQSSSSTPVAVVDLSYDVTAIALGALHSCAEQTSGSVTFMVCWGYNGFNQLGNPVSNFSTRPVQVSNSLGFRNADLGSYHSCAIKDGAAKCWGYGSSGILGNGTTSSSSIPVQVTGLDSGVTDLALGSRHTCAVVSDAVKCWGQNFSGQLGNLAAAAETNSTPIPVTGLDSNITEIEAGLNHTCAIVNDGVKCWGGNDSGQLGVAGNHSIPIEATAFSPFSSGGGGGGGSSGGGGGGSSSGGGSTLVQELAGTALKPFKLKETFIRIRTNGTPVLKGISASKPIGFSSGSAKLDASDRKLIMAVAKKYADQKGSLVVVGFTQRGTQSTVASKKLALARAKAVSNALAKVGGIETVGYVGFGVRNKLNPKSSDNRVAIRWIPATETSSAQLGSNEN